VNDEEDKCPTEPGIVANNGCIDIQPLLNEIASNFKFKTGKSIIASKKLNKLDAAIAELNKYKNISIDIIGNTDNIGTKKVNKKLSERRAAIVYSYLVKKGIEVNRLSKQGDADNNPISTNKTAKGRAENRRTDMKAKY
jgi:outer membrane protein OmpA-like peptidoglycan-associated protein